MRAMQAARFGTGSRLVPVNVPKPHLASGRLLVRMTAAGVTPILRYTVDSGLAGGTPEASAPYVAMCHVSCDTEQAFLDGMALHGKEIFADIASFTDLVPVIQISAVVVG